MTASRWTAAFLDEMLHKSLANSQDWGSTSRLAILNQAQSLVAARFHRVMGFEVLHDTETLTTTASTQEYDLTATVATHLMVYGILDPNGKPLRRKDIKQRNKWASMSAVDGQFGWYPCAPSSVGTGSPKLAVGLLPPPLSASLSFTVHLIRRPRDLVVSPSSSVNVSELPPAADIEILRVAQLLAKSVTPGMLKEAEDVSKLLGLAMAGTFDGQQPSIEHSEPYGVSFYDAYRSLGA